uniref:Putative secreted protein n=1 Tax=Anopheles darlingi TaxID=43151 RepID=A0A2M4DKV9_ANODA
MCLAPGGTPCGLLLIELMLCFSFYMPSSLALQKGRAYTIVSLHTIANHLESPLENNFTNPEETPGTRVAVGIDGTC